MTSDNTPPRPPTAAEAFPDLDVALAARGIALKAGAPRRIAESTPEPSTEAAEPPAVTDDADRLQQHPAAFAGAVLGLALVGLLVFSVVKVSGESTREPEPVMNEPSSSVAAQAPIAAEAPAPIPPPAPPPPVVAAPQLAAATPTAPPPPPVSPPAPSALFNAANLTAQTMVKKPPPAPEAPEESLRSRLRELFPNLFPTP